MKNLFSVAFDQKHRSRTASFILVLAGYIVIEIICQLYKLLFFQKISLKKIYCTFFKDSQKF